ncbi:MAG: methionyl-tRNA formyltransferase [Candidatus Binataceae bacterium]
MNSAQGLGIETLKIVFMGTPALAAHILDRLVAASGPRFGVVGVVTRPDQPRGRGLALEPSEVGAVAARAGIPALKPVKIRTGEFLGQLKAFDPDLIVVAAYGRILPNPVLEAARIMPLNVHLSILPHYRGAAPIEGAILAGDGETGVTIMRITERMDAGPILLQRAIPIAAGDTQATLKSKLAELGAVLLLEAIEKLRRGALVETPQDESKATYTAPVKKEDAIIDWSADAVRIERMTRAYDPWPIARTTMDGEPILIYRAAAEPAPPSGDAPGTILWLKPAPTVQCGLSRMVLLEVQAPGRKRMGAADFCRGRRIEAGRRLGT